MRVLANPSLVVLAATAVAFLSFTLACHGGGTADPRSPPTQATATAPDDPSPTSGSEQPAYPPNTSFSATDQFDFSRLPTVNTSDWREWLGPQGTLVVRLPPSWVVVWSTTYSATDQSARPFGDGVAIGKPIQPPPEGRSAPGWVKVDLPVLPFRARLSQPDALVRPVSLTASRPVAGFQYGAAPDYPDFLGGLDLEVELSLNGKYLNGYAHADFPATAEDIATLVEILQQVELR